MIADCLAVLGGALMIVCLAWGAWDLATAQRAPRCTVCGKEPQLIGPYCQKCAWRKERRAAAAQRLEGGER